MPDKTYDWDPKALYFQDMASLAGKKEVVLQYIFKHPETIAKLPQIGECVNQLSQKATQDQSLTLEQIKENLNYIKSQIPPNKEDIQFWVDKQKTTGVKVSDLTQILKIQIEKIKKFREVLAQKVYEQPALLPEETKLLDGVDLLGKENLKLFSRLQMIRLLKNYEIAGYFVLGELNGWL